MKLLQRDIVAQIKGWLDKPEIIVLLGARQVGKSSIMQLIMQDMEQDSFIYLDLEDSYNLEIVSSVDKFLDYIKLKTSIVKKKINVFIDEFQYMEDPSRFLKILHDHYPEFKLIISGSSSFEMQKRFSDALTGRKIVFTVYPLNFAEYLIFKNNEYKNIKSEINLRKILENYQTAEKASVITQKMLPLLEDHIIFGGYPLPTLTQDIESRLLRLKEVHNTYIQKDIKDLARIENVLQFNRLVSFLSLQIAGLLNLNEVSKEVGLNRQRLEHYLFILEKTFVLYLLKPFYTNQQKEITKMPKLFFNDTGLRNMNINDTRVLNLRDDKGKLAENFFLQEIMKKQKVTEKFHYWRTKQKKEVDFVIIENKKPMPVEIKYQRFTEPELSSSLRAFIEVFHSELAIVVTRDYLDRIRYKDKTEVLFIPLWMV